MKFNPHPYQTEAIDHALNKGQSILLMDCGLGKTVVTLSYLNQLFRNMLIKGALVVAPLRVARLTWPLEIDQWDHTDWMTYTFLHGPDKAEKLKEKKAIYLINYEGLPWLYEQLSTIPIKDWPFDTVVWDELTRMKAHDSVRFRGIDLKSGRI